MQQSYRKITISPNRGNEIESSNKLQGKNVNMTIEPKRKDGTILSCSNSSGWIMSSSKFSWGFPRNSIQCNES